LVNVPNTHAIDSGKFKKHSELILQMIFINF